MAERIILCGQCGSKNRVPLDRVGQPKCGECGKALHIPGAIAGGFKSDPAKVLWGLILCAAVLVAIRFSVSDVSYHTDERSAPTPAIHEKETVQGKIAPSFNAVSVPVEVGVIDHPRNTSVAPLAIKTSPGRDYFVKLVDRDGQLVMSMYVRGGQYFETTVPLGAFEMRYASGGTWYGAELLFGPETSFAKANSQFNFTFDGRQYSGYTVELIARPHGNLMTSRLSASDF